MAETGDAHPNAQAHPQEAKAHEATYTWFIGLLKISTIVTVIVAAFVVFLIAS